MSCTKEIVQWPKQLFPFPPNKGDLIEKHFYVILLIPDCLIYELEVNYVITSFPLLVQWILCRTHMIN